MKKWKAYMMLAVLCISMVGCGKKDSGSELLTEVQETVTPVEEVVKPEGEETPEGIRLHVYLSLIHIWWDLPQGSRTGSTGNLDLR